MAEFCSNGRCTQQGTTQLQYEPHTQHQHQTGNAGAKFLFAQGCRYKLHDATLPGKPDIVLPKYKTVIFIHGCFWHGHNNCKYYKVPQTRTEWWLNKIGRNKSNDAAVVKALKKEGWKMITVWECDLKPEKVDKTLHSLLKKLQ